MKLAIGIGATLLTVVLTILTYRKLNKTLDDADKMVNDYDATLSQIKTKLGI